MEAGAALEEEELEEEKVATEDEAAGCVDAVVIVGVEDISAI